ncbi:Lrp/AsnC family transcriptional regulator, partial [Streptococcus agalactiae]|uniref:Lrp/AsnC family transcriptional regulator n=1 Tax=Streptococcus agalactiae TaxID=1311 RepID=UPI0018EF1BE8
SYGNANEISFQNSIENVIKFHALVKMKYYFILDEILTLNFMTEPTPLDELDRRILNALQTDASQTNTELAELVHVSPPTCLRRVKQLTDAGVIERQVAIVDPAKVGARLTAIVEITLDVQAAERMEAFEKLAAV